MEKQKINLNSKLDLDLDFKEEMKDKEKNKTIKKIETIIKENQNLLKKMSDI